MGTIPSAEELVERLLRASPSYTPEQRETLLSLYAGDADDGDDGSADGTLSELRLYGVAGCNSFGEDFTDFASLQARTSGKGGDAPRDCPDCADRLCGHGGDQQAGHLGLFPSFSMLNHSCLPNAVNFVLAGRMMVFAARRVPQGSEVLINYLGRASLRPVEERQSMLADGYHFACDCPRCGVELLAGCDNSGGGASSGGTAGFGETLQAILERCQQREQILGGLCVPPPSAIPAPVGAPHAGELQGAATRCLEGVRADVQLLESLLARQEAAGAGAGAATLAGLGDPTTGARGSPTGGAPHWLQWLRASAFDLYAQHVTCAEALGLVDEADAALRLLVGVCEAVAPHSDLHMYLAVKQLSLCQARWGPDSERAVEQLRGCAAVLRGRYGAELSDPTVARLLRGAAHGLAQIQL
ncbi:hypothetical protein GPECTOR_87g409 [Gonium pectorale]|uniref:SET domain-containing protein n=1 Tax=Gonium pectorale TaxID=33097 RepID=A0A150G131_GONPE|nr:hypothetical protein GPECTOR_87g409 [Gonium pectorale]|eukprot:KXZ43547.1 hypothetical protein GPECTOR_87g409 [Gonium pectorale]